MRKILLLASLLFAVAFPCFAQKHIYPVASNIAPSGRYEYMDYSAKEFSSFAADPVVIITKQGVNDYQCVPNPGNPPTGNIRVYCDSGTGLLTCLTSAGASCAGSSSLAFSAITAGTNTAALVIGSGGSLGTSGSGTITATGLSGTPALPNGTTATTQPVNDNTTKLATDAFVLANRNVDNSFIYATSFGAVPDARFNNDGTTVAGSNLLDAPTLNCTAADVGKLVIVARPGTGTQIYSFGTGLVTVLSCNSPTEAVLSANCTAVFGGAGTGMQWAIGTDNGAFLNAASMAAWNGNTQALALPCGAMIVATPPFVTTAVSSWAQPFNVTGCIGTVGTQFILHPHITVGVGVNGSFFYTPGTVSGYIPVGGADYDVTNIRLTTLGGPIPMAAGAMFVFKGSGSSLRMRGVQIHDFYSNNAVNCTIIANATGEAYYDLLNIQHTNCYNIAFGGQGPNTLSNSVLAFHTEGNQAVTCASAICNFNSDYILTGDPIQLAGTGSVMNVNGGNYVGTPFTATGSGHRLNLTGIVDGIGAGGALSNVDSTNMSVYVVNSTFTNASNATPNIFKGSGPVFDVGGNTATNTNGPIMNAATPLFGSASITGTALVAGNVGLTSGWDTSTVSAVGAGSNSHQGTFTITAAGTPGAGPVITLTFPTPFWAAPAFCTLQQISGTLGVLTVPLNAAGTPTLTTVAFTLSGTAVATQLYTFSYGCS